MDIDEMLPNDYHRARAIMATLFNAAMLTDPAMYRDGHNTIAESAIHAADALLDRLGIIDPDRQILPLTRPES